MNKILSIRDLIPEHDASKKPLDSFSISGPLLESFKEIGIHVLPADAPADGVFGCIICDINDQAVCYSTKVFDRAKRIEHDDFDSFNKELSHCLSHDWLILKQDDAKRLLIGFVCVRNSGTEWHMLRLSAYAKRNAVQE